MQKKHHVFTRKELYKLVWSEPMRNLAQKYSISDRGLAKACNKADIPTPPLGYWARKQAGREPHKPLLPSRGLGMSDEVIIGGNHWSSRYSYCNDEQALAMVIPPPPVFEASMESVAERVRKMVAKVKIPKTMATTHHLIDRLLEEDNIRRQKSEGSEYSWDKPIFDTAFEKRRLKILNSIFVAVDRCGFKPSIRGKEAREIHVGVGEQWISLKLDSTKATHQIERERYGYVFLPRGENDPLELSVNYSTQDTYWKDSKDSKIEAHLTQIIEAIIIAGEANYRSSAEGHHKWLGDRKANAEETLRKRIAEEERVERERQEKLEQARVDYLLKQANEMRQAAEIRGYVQAVRAANTNSNNPLPADEFEDWAAWALAQADRIDPVLSGRYKVKS